MQVGCIALILVCAIDSVKGILLFTASTRPYAAIFVSPLLQTVSFVRVLSIPFIKLTLYCYMLHEMQCHFIGKKLLLAEIARKLSFTSKYGSTHKTNWNLQRMKK